MKKIEAMVLLSEVSEVKYGLAGIGIETMTITEVKAFGRLGQAEVYRGRTYRAPYVAEAKVEIVVPDEATEGAIAVIRKASLAEEPWDQRIFVSSLDDARPFLKNKTVAAA